VSETAFGGDVDGVVGYHLNPLTCGVAKFNVMLARHLEVQIFGLFDNRAAALRRPLLSVKISEFAEADAEALASLVETAPWRDHFALFLHEWTETPTEQLLLSLAEVVFCGNDELVASLRNRRAAVEKLWCPSTLLEPQRFASDGISVFAFGMAHKVRPELHRTFQALLEKTGRPYSVYLSTALHEGTAFDESFTAVFEELKKIYGNKIYFLGYLSDTAVYNYLLDTTFFTAFFEKGVRANNTTVNAAMDCGAVVVTNLDEYSPEVFGHMHNVIDINRCDGLPVSPDILGSLAGNARATASTAMGWDSLVARIKML
tara:strand:- start:1014 stop:1961 length:948 start_codon:yes stop_codon:yes gene_type:complete